MKGNTMEKRKYISPEMEVVSMETACILEGLSEKIPTTIIYDGELDANGTQLFDTDSPTNKLWDDE